MRFPSKESKKKWQTRREKAGVLTVFEFFWVRKWNNGKQLDHSSKCKNVVKFSYCCFVEYFCFGRVPDAGKWDATLTALFWDKHCSCRFLLSFWCTIASHFLQIRSNGSKRFSQVRNTQKRKKRKKRMKFWRVYCDSDRNSGGYIFLGGFLLCSFCGRGEFYVKSIIDNSYSVINLCGVVCKNVFNKTVWTEFTTARQNSVLNCLHWINCSYYWTYFFLALSEQCEVSHAMWHLSGENVAVETNWGPTAIPTSVSFWKTFAKFWSKTDLSEPKIRDSPIHIRGSFFVWILELRHTNQEKLIPDLPDPIWFIFCFLVTHPKSTTCQHWCPYWVPTRVSLFAWSHFLCEGH